jgi:phytoene dehydrogenase-like protein
MDDAVIIGAGPNGLVAANLLADAGWEVTVLEAKPAAGGGVSSVEHLGHGWVSDVCSAFYPLAASSPIFESLDVEAYGVRWSHAPAVVAHPRRDGQTAMLYRDVEATADALEASSPGDGAAWTRLHGLWQRAGTQVLEALSTPFPPLRPAVRLGRELGAGGALRFGRFATLPVRRLADEEFQGVEPGLILAGCALHADFFPESSASAFFGWLMAMLGHHAGYPVVEGGAGRLAEALVRRLEARGGTIQCNQSVTAVEIRGRRAVGVITAGGERLGARHAVLADVPATQLYGGLVEWDHLPATMVDDVRRFQWDWATLRFDWALKAPVPWEAQDVAKAGTVHLGESLDALTRFSAQIAQGLIPADPFILLGQLTTSDAKRSPMGTELLYGYTHVPRVVRGDAGDGGIRGSWDASDLDAMTDRLESHIERYAPGFRALITDRDVLSPTGLEEHNPSLVGGAINGGTAAIHQQLVFRPTPGLGRSETPIAGLFLASSSAHPGGGVHGICGANAARAAIRAKSYVGRAFVTPGLARLTWALHRPLL